MPPYGPPIMVNHLISLEQKEIELRNLANMLRETRALKCDEF
jgi:hypothetical protein